MEGQWGVLMLGRPIPKQFTQEIAVFSNTVGARSTGHSVADQEYSATMLSKDRKAHCGANEKKSRETTTLNRKPPVRQ